MRFEDLASRAGKAAADVGEGAVRPAIADAGAGQRRRAVISGLAAVAGVAAVVAVSVVWLGSGSEPVAAPSTTATSTTVVVTSPPLATLPTRDACPVTEPGNTPFTPAAVTPDGPPDSYASTWFGTPRLWTMVGTDGQDWSSLPVTPEGAFVQKTFWWSDDFDAAEESVPDITVTLEQVGGTTVVREDDSTSGSHAELGRFMLVGVEIPEAGCWRVTAEYRDASLGYVAWVDGSSGGSPAPQTDPEIIVPALPEGDAFVLDAELEPVVADLLVAVEGLGWTTPIGLEASTEDDGHVAVTIAGTRIGDVPDSSNPVLPERAETTVRVYPTTEAAAAAAATQMNELLQGIPRVTQERIPFDLVDAGEESAASLFTLQNSVIADFVVRDGTWVVSMHWSTEWPEGVDPEPAFLDAVRSDEVQGELGSFLDAILGGRGTDHEVSLIRIPLIPPTGDASTYEHQWTMEASSIRRIERSQTLAVTPTGVRCRILDLPYEADEPEDYTEYFDDGSGTVTLSRRYFDENDEIHEDYLDLPDDDPQYLQILSGCLRFEPVSEVLDIVVDAWPEPASGAAQLAATGEAYPTDDNAWVIVEQEVERGFDLDPALLVALGITNEPGPEGVEITRWFAWVYAEAVQFEVNATGRRSVIESAFGVDLSDMPDRQIEFTLGFAFTLSPDGPGEW
jgi:hypothetical protein